MSTSFLSHLECTNCHKQYSADELHTVCPVCGRVLFARYDLDQARQQFSPSALGNRAWSMWRWRELLPVRDASKIVTLGEGMTPLLHAQRLGAAHGFPALFIKEEG